MILNSFIFLDRVGPAAEQNLWRQGIISWSDFLNKDTICGLSKATKRFHDRNLVMARNAISQYDSSYFLKCISNRHQWRLFEHFRDDIAYLDIETEGGYGNITLVGIYDGFDTKIMIRNNNLDKRVLKQELEKYRVLVTFNGSSFDIPVLKKYFGEDIIPNIPHIDLRGVCSQIGLKGGLKSIEQQIGIARPDDLKYVYGSDAAYLWHKYSASGNKKYLDILIRYNEEDIINLKALATHAIPLLWKQTFSHNAEE